MNNNQCLEAVLECLNSAYKADPAAISAMLINLVPCNQKMVDHPHMVVKTDVGPSKTPTLSALGMINGVLTAAGLPRVAIKWSEIKDHCSRSEFVGFVRAGDSCQPSEHRIEKKNRKK